MHIARIGFDLGKTTLQLLYRGQAELVPPRSAEEGRRRKNSPTASRKT